MEKPPAPATVAKRKRAPPSEIAEKLAQGRVTIGQALGLTDERLYQIAQTAHQFLQAGLLPKALVLYKGLVRAAPSDSVFHCQLAATYLALGRFDEAFGEYEKALQFNRANVDALVGRGEVHLRNQRVPEALEDLAAAIKLDP
ncbi:MAG: tetratricopeptide repeat protein, partial [Deltaproteobacteria bacterium]|nr:tetratricopeptide repeat protein [Deltaproteobacteria bacterium]